MSAAVKWIVLAVLMGGMIYQGLLMCWYPSDKWWGR